ncbi:hypothetical protein L1987_06451 [Smallanthus sonchifolius]|uniref:Uncharacterized protein n=1 Tax=Smallanthus sonchifolius TaxID=185202 RepID=A0ACB9JY96_9ASTR|nr:hypothetical protein L1987_06451 [Smallanthus sonchifolius]
MKEKVEGNSAAIGEVAKERVESNPTTTGELTKDAETGGEAGDGKEGCFTFLNGDQPLSMFNNVVMGSLKKTALAFDVWSAIVALTQYLIKLACCKLCILCNTMML